MKMDDGNDVTNLTNAIQKKVERALYSLWQTLYKKNRPAISLKKSIHTCTPFGDFVSLFFLPLRKKYVSYTLYILKDSPFCIFHNLKKNKMPKKCTNMSVKSKESAFQINLV